MDEGDTLVEIFELCTSTMSSVRRRFPSEGLSYDIYDYHMRFHIRILFTVLPVLRSRNSKEQS